MFSSEQDGWNRLYSIAAKGGPPTLLTPGEFETEDVTLIWDKKTIFYSSNQGDVDRRHIWRVPVNSGTPVAVTRGRNDRVVAGGDWDGAGYLVPGIERHKSGDALLWKTWVAAHGATANFFDRVFEKGEPISISY